MKTKFPLIAAFFLTFFMTSHAQAQSQQPQTDFQDRLKGAVGIFDVTDDDDAAEFRLEYQWGQPLLYEVRPFAGAMTTGDGGIYGYGGLYLPWEFTPRFFITPSLAAGFYEDGGGKDLGHAIEFRSEIELAYEIFNSHRFGVAFSHMSNASLSDDNPGAESVMLTYSVPTSLF